MLKLKYNLSMTRSCKLVSISKPAYYYKPRKKADNIAICCYLKALSDEHKRWGFDKMMLKIKSDKKPWNHKRVYRIYCELGLNIRIKPRKRIPKGQAKALLQLIKPNICWSMDFMSDALHNGRRFRMFNVIDDYNRQALLVEPSYSLPTSKVTFLLDILAVEPGYPEMIRVDNGPGFASSSFKTWASNHGILLHYIQPGKPAKNGYVDRFNRTFREDILDMNWFSSLTEIKTIYKKWLKVYNQDRPHESLDGLAPVPFAKQRKKRLANKRGNSTFK